MNTFPNKVWEPTGTDENGKTLWSSRPATAADYIRRRKWIKGFQERRDNNED